jgi:hypothetical protein
VSGALLLNGPRHSEILFIALRRVWSSTRRTQMVEGQQKNETIKESTQIRMRRSTRRAGKNALSAQDSATSTNFLRGVQKIVLPRRYHFVLPGCYHFRSIWTSCKSRIDFLVAGNRGNPFICGSDAMLCNSLLAYCNHIWNGGFDSHTLPPTI